MGGYQVHNQIFQNEGAARGTQVGADWDSIWQLSIDPCVKCHIMGGSRGVGLLTKGAQALSSLAMPLVASVMFMLENVALCGCLHVTEM